MRVDQPALAHQWVLSRPLADASKRYSPMKATDVIEYFYAGGCAYLQLGDWDRAESFFEQVRRSGGDRVWRSWKVEC